MRTVYDILKSFIDKSLWELNCKDFVMKKYPKACTKFHNGWWYITSYGSVLGSGVNEEKAWENVIERMLK